MKIYKDIIQNSEEWLDLRLGKFTASMFGDLFAAKTTLTYEKAINKIVFERLTGEQVEQFTSAYMERGHELEQDAIELYERLTFNDVERVGFVELSDWVGCSPDGLVGDDGGLEIKCPSYNTMIRYLKSGKLPSEYRYQVHGSMMVTGRKWWDFMAYHPSLKPLIIRVERDEQIIASISDKVTEAINEAVQTIELIK